MSNCVFCQKEEEVLFGHLSLDMGLRCLDDYIKFHYFCGLCNQSLMPIDVFPNTDYQIKAKFIGMGDKNLIVCDHCNDAILNEFSFMFKG